MTDIQWNGISPKDLRNLVNRIKPALYGSIWISNMNANYDRLGYEIRISWDGTHLDYQYSYSKTQARREFWIKYLSITLNIKTGKENVKELAEGWGF